MKITEMLYVKNRQTWRQWLRKYHKTKKEIWLVYYKKHSKKPRIPYDDAVEEALCFGWIDSTVKRLDDEKYVQKYTPRRSGSIWSNTNILRAERMIRQRKMTKAGLVMYNETKMKKTRTVRAPIVAQRLKVPPDLRAALEKNKKAAQHFKAFAPSYRKMYIWYIVSAKKPETRQRRIKKVVGLAAQNKKSVML
jgi:uncharacterized protein YdeI (YjbR/CyaY-like superfamily)